MSEHHAPNTEVTHEYTRLISDKPRITVAVKHRRDGDEKSQIQVYRARSWDADMLTLDSTDTARRVGHAMIEGADWIDANGPVIYPGVMSPPMTVVHHHHSAKSEPKEKSGAAGDCIEIGFLILWTVFAIAAGVTLERFVL